MEINNEDKEIIEELKKITKNKKELNKAQKKIKFAMWSILICNFIAGCFMGSIYFIIDNIIYLIIGIVLILLDIPAYKSLNKIIEKLEEN
jgi:hypothetical protein